MTLYREDPLKAVDWEGNPRRSSDSGAGTSGANTYFVYMGYYWKGVQLPLTAYHLPLPAFRLPLPASRLPLPAYHLPLTAYRLPLTAYRIPPTTLILRLSQPNRHRVDVEPRVYTGAPPLPAGVRLGCNLLHHRRRRVHALGLAPRFLRPTAAPPLQ